MKYLIVLFFLYPMVIQAEADFSNFKVVHVRVDKSGKGYMKFDKPLAGTPASCISGHDYHLAFDLNTPGGQGIMSLALAAQASGKKVRAKGTGECGIYTSLESWSWGYIYE